MATRSSSAGGRESVLHLRKLGIQLKSNPAWNTLKARPPTVPLRSRPLRRKPPAATPLTPNSDFTFVSDLVVPLPFNPDETNLQRSATAHSFYSTSRTKQLPLPHVSEQRMSRSPVSAKSVNLHGERFVPVDTKERTLKIPPSPTFSVTSNSPLWNQMSQKDRIQAEQEARERSREMKRTSEIMSHRQDRRYYMTGSQFNMRDKYDIDMDELERLRKKYADRQHSARSRYSDALAAMDYKTDEKNAEGGKQSTPGGYLPHVVDADGQQVFLTEQEASNHPHQPTVESTKRVNTPVTNVNSVDKQGDVYINDEFGDMVKSAKSVHFSKTDHVAILNNETVINNDNIAQDGDLVGGETESRSSDSTNNESIDFVKIDQGKMEILDKIEEDEENNSVSVVTEENNNWIPPVKKEIISSLDHVTPQFNKLMESVKRVDEPAVFKIDKEMFKPNKQDALNVDFSRPPELEPPPPPPPPPEPLNLDELYSSNNFDMDTLNKTLKSLEDQLFNVDHLKGTEGWVFPDDSSDEEEEEEEDGYFEEGPQVPEGSELDARTMFRKRTESLKPAQSSDDMGLSDLYMYSFISDQQRAVFTEKFHSIDADGNGVLSMKELHQKLFMNATKRDIALFMKVFDLNKDKTIELNEFVTVAALNDRLTGHVSTSSEEPLELNLPKLAYYITTYREMFELVDQDCSGKISLNEMMVVLTAGMNSEVGTDKDFVEVLLQTIDKDKSGTIDFVEYLSYIPFFLHIHRHLMNKEVLVEDIEKARLSVRQALRSKPQYKSYYKKTDDIWADF